MTYEKALEERLDEALRERASTLDSLERWRSEAKDLKRKLADASLAYDTLNQAYMQLARKITLYEEFWRAHEAVEQGVTDFELHEEAVDRYRRARLALFEIDG